MNLSELTERHPKAVALTAVIVLAIALGLVLARGGGARTHGPRDAVYYVDLQTRQLFTAREQLPPIAAPSGGQGVRAYVFGCGGCDEAQRFTAYLENYTEEARAALEESRSVRDPAARDALDRQIERGHTVALFDPQQELRWVPESGSAGQQVIRSFTQRCSDAATCEP